MTKLNRLLKDAFYAWKSFHLAQRKLYLVSWYLQQDLESKKLQQNPQQLTALNNKRMLLQKEIAVASRKSNACSKCRGRCCSGDHNLYTALDCVIRSYSDKPLTSYGYLPQGHELLSNYSALSKPLRYLLKSSHISDGSFASKKMCAKLTETGCSLPVEDRPIICSIFTCKEFRDGLPYKELIKLVNLMIEIQSIECTIAGLLSKKSLLKAKIRCAMCI